MLSYRWLTLTAFVVSAQQQLSEEQWMMALNYVIYVAGYSEH